MSAISKEEEQKANEIPYSLSKAISEIRLEYIELIDGELSQPTDFLDNWICNPMTGDKIIQQRKSNQNTLERVLWSAWRVSSSSSWSKISSEERANYLKLLANELEIEEYSISLLDTLNTGVTLELTKAISSSYKNDLLQATAEQIEKVKKDSTINIMGEFGLIQSLNKPRGVALILVPWNVPIGSSLPKIISALVAGCVVIIKPSEWSPFSMSLFANAVYRAKFPPGVIQIVHGDGSVGSFLVSDQRINVVNFTGSCNNGKCVARLCGENFKPLLAELGGSNPFIVLADANVEIVADGIIRSLTALNGQWCAGVGRILVHESLKTTLLEKLAIRLNQLKIGDPFNKETDVGPLSNIQNYNAVLNSLNSLLKKGGTQIKSIHESKKLGFFVYPTIIDGLKNEDCLEEIFGPVCSIHSFQVDNEAISLSNQASGILMANVFSSSVQHATNVGHHITSGLIMINGVGFGFDSDTQPPFSFWGSSGIGTDGNLLALFNFFSSPKVIGSNGKATPEFSTESNQTFSPSQRCISSKLNDKSRLKYYSRLRLS